MALATDYDGTLAIDGRVDAPTIEALREVKGSGRKLILVTGRDLRDLQRDSGIGPVRSRRGGKRRPSLQPDEEGRDASRRTTLTRVRGTLTRAWCLTALRWSHQETVLDVIQEFALELHIVFNKGAVVVLPGNVNKAWGLKSALKPLCLSPHNVVGIGNAENDQVFLSACGCAVEDPLLDPSPHRCSRWRQGARPDTKSQGRALAVAARQPLRCRPEKLWQKSTNGRKHREGISRRCPRELLSCGVHRRRLDLYNRTNSLQRRRLLLKARYGSVHCRKW